MTFWNLREDPEIPGDGALDIDGEIVAEKCWLTPDGACVARDFRKALGQMRNVTVRINSPGGDVMAGAEIYSALREHSLNGKGTVTVVITALAASAASVIAMAGDRVLMSPTAYMMIHNPWTMAVGDSRELRKAAKVLDVIGEGLINAYEIRTNKTRDELKRMLENETWMSAATCVEEGFADGIIGAETAEGTERAAALVKMSAKSHGPMEIAARIRGAGIRNVDEEDDPEPDEETEEEPDEETEPDAEEEPEETEEPEEGEPEEEPDDRVMDYANREDVEMILAMMDSGFNALEAMKRVDIARRAEAVVIAMSSVG